MPVADRIAAARRWLRSPGVVDGRGRVISWQSDDRPGFAYPEAGGLLLRLWSEAEIEESRADEVAAWLAAEVAADTIGKGGARYTFDLAVVLAGLLAHAARYHRGPGSVVISGLQRLGACILAGNARDPASDERWSSRFGPHLRKAAVALVCAGDAADRQWSRRVAAALRERTGGGAIMPWSPTPGADATYVHAAAYALEGELLLDGLGQPWRTGDRDEAMAWLAHVQRADGGLPAWWSAERGGFGPSRSDATAQAVRLWSAVDRRRFSDSIERALAWLAATSDNDGAVRYASDCRDRNVWSTVFACQAVELASGAGDPLRLV